MFVKKLVEKASRKPGSTFDGLKGCEVEPCLAFHYGIPSGSTISAYDSIQKILALSTKDGRIKLFGKDNTQTLLESKEAIPSKFLQFMENQGYLLNVTAKNQIEVWDIDRKLLAHVHVFEEEITSFTILQQSPYIYVGDYLGNVSILKLDQSLSNIIHMKYIIPVSASRGNPAEVISDASIITHILPQPTIEFKRVLLIFNDGLITLWEIKESKSIFITGGNTMLSPYQDAKKVTSACWVCPLGSKVAVGYSNGDVSIWAILYGQNPKAESPSENNSRTGPLYKLNLGYKLDKIPIASLRCNYVDAKTSRLYVMGASSNSLQVILLNEQIETRTIKLGLQLSEACIDMEIISSLSDHSKNKQDSLLLLGKSGCVYAYDDCLIEKYLLQQSQSRSATSLPKEAMLRIPFVDSNITVSRFFTNNSCSLYTSDEDYIQRTKEIPSLFLFEPKPKEVTYLNTVQFGGFSKVENLYISGHNDGSINFWDASCPIFIPILSLQQQSEDDFSLTGIPVTALHFDGSSPMLVSGDHSGTVRVFKFRPEPYAADNSYMPFQGTTKKRNNHIIQSVKLVNVDGSVLAINISPRSNHLAVGSDKGYVSLFDIQGSNLIYQKRIASEISTGIISLQFESCNLQGFEKNVLTIATKDSSLLALDSETGNTLSASIVHPKKPSRALFMQILYGQDAMTRGSVMSDDLELGKVSSLAVDGVPKQSLVLLCSEKAAYIYSFVHAVQGVKKVLYKKKFHSSCCWALTFYSNSDVGLLLVFGNGKIEIRSLPELSLLKETSVRGFKYSPPKVNSLPVSTICSSKDGELLVVNGDQEIFIVSVLCNKKIFRILDSFSHIYRKDYVISPEGTIAHKEKKKGIFTSVFQEISGSKAKQAPDFETEDTRENIEELTVIFSASNFHRDVKIAEGTEKLVANEDNSELDIDDIELEDPVEKPKEQSMLASLNKQKFASTFSSLKGKLKQMKVKSEKNSAKEEQPDWNADNKAGAVDQIKKKYGFSSAGETSVAKMTESKLQENAKKLQGINLRATDMQDTAKSFSSMANQLLRTAEQGKRN